MFSSKELRDFCFAKGKICKVKQLKSPEVI